MCNHTRYNCFHLRRLVICEYDFTILHSHIHNNSINILNTLRWLIFHFQYTNCKHRYKWRTFHISRNIPAYFETLFLHRIIVQQNILL